MKIRIPPIKCQGIKSKLVPWILDNIKWKREGRWLEPFFGSGVVGFNVLPDRAVFSDINPHIINFYQAIYDRKIDPCIVKAFLKHEGNILSQKGKDYYYEVRERFNEHGKPLDFLFLNRCCFNGLVRFNKNGKFNTPFGHKPNRFSQSYITKITNQADYIFRIMKDKDWHFICQDFRLTLKAAKEQDFIYCDPPYIGRHVDYYNTWGKDEEGALYNALKKINTPFILSTWLGNEYRKNEYIDSYWSAFHLLKREHFYHVGAKEANRKPMIEALVCNFDPVDNSVSVSDRLEQESLLNFLS